MSFEKEIRDLYSKEQEKYFSNISMDFIIFGFHHNELKVLLLQTKYAGLWVLPGGFILKDEHLDNAAKRILQVRTGVNDIYMQQFQVFNEPDRSNKKINKQFLKNIGTNMDESWMF
ncbi:MAG: NUDIX domain-containing protein [Ferruginibacter sp.]